MLAASWTVFIPRASLSVMSSLMSYQIWAIAKSSGHLESQEKNTTHEAHYVDRLEQRRSCPEYCPMAGSSEALTGSACHGNQRTARWRLS